MQLATEVKYIVHGECGSHKQGLQGHVLENTGSQVSGDTLAVQHGKACNYICYHGAVPKNKI